MNKSLILGITLFAGLSGAATAQVSTAPEYRGYNECIEVAETEASGLVPTREYFIARSDSMNQYFINATAWADGDRVDVRVACDTSRNGREVLELEVAEGRFVLDEGRVNVRVAAN
jgi:hypothetical protein